MFNKLFQKKSSKDTAKERLMIILECDKQCIPPNLMENLRNDIIKVLSKYLDINENAIDLNLQNNVPLTKPHHTSKVLTASIPIRSNPLK